MLITLKEQNEMVLKEIKYGIGASNAGTWILTYKLIMQSLLAVLGSDHQ